MRNQLNECTDEELLAQSKELERQRPVHRSERLSAHGHRKACAPGRSLRRTQ
jgi:hypothetical protein